MEDRKDSLAKGTIILAVAGLISRIIGSVYRIFLPRLIGAEGIGLYQMAFQIFTLFLCLITPGITLAISRLIAIFRSREEKENILIIMRSAAILLAVLGLSASILLYFYSGAIARVFFQDYRVSFPMMALSPGLFFISIMSLFRGYFQGYNQMLPTAVSQIIEQVVRFIIMMGLLLFVLKGPIEGLAAGAAFAGVCGEAAAFVCMLFFFAKKRSTDRLMVKGATITVLESYKSLLGHAIPIGIGSMIIPLVGVFNSGIIPLRLQLLGFTPAEATALYGQYSGMALAVYHFPLVLISALAVNLVPTISQLAARGDSCHIRRLARRALGFSLQITIPAATGFIVLGSAFCDLLFAYPQAGIILGYVAPSLVFLGMQLTLAGVLQGLGHAIIPLVNLFFGTVANAFFTYILTGYMGIIGAALGTGLGYTLAGILNFLVVGKKIGLIFDLRRHLIVPMAAGVTMGIFVFCIHALLKCITSTLLLQTLIPIGLGVLYYIIFMVVFRGIEPSDIEIIPLIGSKLSLWLQ